MTKTERKLRDRHIQERRQAAMNMSNDELIEFLNVERSLNWTRADLIRLYGLQEATP